MDGLISLDVAVKSTTANIESLLSNGSGRLNFAIWPRDFEAGVFDLWTVSLLSLLLPKLDTGDQPKFNCIVAHLVLDQGLLKEKRIYVDTTNVYVDGTASVNFESEKINLVLIPTAKRPELFSLETPVEVDGSFDDFAVGVAPADVIRTTISFATSPIHVPVRWLFSDQPSQDGAEECMAAWEQGTPVSKVKSDRNNSPR